MATDLKPGEVGFGTPFAAAIDYLRRKLDLPTERWDDIKRSTHDRAFIVAGAAKADLLHDLHQAVIAAAEGEGLAGFRKSFKDIVARHGWTGWTGEGSAAGTGWRTRVIYQTNMATSYAAGRWRQLTDPAVAEVLPWFAYRHADGVLHPRPLHQAWDGLTLRQDHPFWRTHWAPNGWGCHCKVFAVAKPAPGARTEPPAGWDAIDPSTGEPVGIDRGFGHAPGAHVGTSLRQMVQDKLVTYPPAIARALSVDLNRRVYAQADVAGWVDQVLADRQLSDPLVLGFVEDAQAVQTAAAPDVELQGYMVTLPGSTPRHVQTAHRHDGQGQRAATPQDYTHVAELLNSADSLRAGHPHDGHDTVVATKVIDGETWRGVFEVLPGKRNRALALLSLVIKTEA